MKDMINAPFVRELCLTADNMYRLGWDERNGGNISLLLNESEVKEYADVTRVLRTLPLHFDATELAGKYFLVTGTGKYFKNVLSDPETNWGVIRIADNGTDAELIWGYKNSGSFTSELPAHLMSHISGLNADPDHRVVMHCHPTYTIAMNTVCPVDESDFTHRLWSINTEAIVVFPDGVGMLPWMVCGTNEIGVATAKKMKEFRLVVWTNHGIYGRGKDLDETFGLIETVEKTAQIYMLTEGKERVNLISDAELRAISARFSVNPRPGVLKQ